MLSVGVAFESLSNPDVVAECLKHEEDGNSVVCVAGRTPLQDVMDRLDSIGLDIPVLYGEEGSGWDITIGCVACEGARNAFV